MLVTCPECQAKVSEVAYRCPRCGFEYYAQGWGPDKPFRISAKYWPKDQADIKKRDKEKEQQRDAYDRMPVYESDKNTRRRAEAESNRRDKGCLIPIIIWVVITAIIMIILYCSGKLTN